MSNLTSRQVIDYKRELKNKGYSGLVVKKDDDGLYDIFYKKFKRPKVKRTLVKMVSKQTHKRKSVKADRDRTARLPGIKFSATGRKYWERRDNRSDKKGSRL